MSKIKISTIRASLKSRGSELKKAKFKLNGFDAYIVKTGDKTNTYTVNKLRDAYKLGLL